MDIYIFKEGNQYGPYTIVRVRELLASGQLTEDDRACHEGLPEWVALGTLVAKPSPHDIASEPADWVFPTFRFVVSWILLIAILIMFNLDENHPIMVHLKRFFGSKDTFAHAIAFGTVGCLLNLCSPYWEYSRNKKQKIIFHNDLIERKENAKKEGWCPRGCQKLRPWNDRLRCWDCGYPEK